MDLATLQSRFALLQSEATLLAGDLFDIPRRVLILYHMYRDSKRNHAFSLIAAHGALWASNYFEVGGSLGRLIGKRYFYNPTERAFRLGLLREFAEKFRAVNRQVCIDSYTNYHFTRRYGHLPGAETLVPAPLLDALNRVHWARERDRELTEAERKQVFEQSFLCEQEVTVAPGVQAAVDGFDCKIMRFLCLRPVVRFAYFPGWRYLWFRDFSNKQERITKGLHAFDLAVRMGWPHVDRSLRDYGMMDQGRLEAPEASLAALRDGLARDAARAAEIFGSPNPGGDGGTERSQAS